MRIMNDQICTVDAGQSVFTRANQGRMRSASNRIAGEFFEFSLSHPARSGISELLYEATGLDGSVVP